MAAIKKKTDKPMTRAEVKEVMDDALITSLTKFRGGWKMQIKYSRPLDDSDQSMTVTVMLAPKR